LLTANRWRSLRHFSVGDACGFSYAIPAALDLPERDISVSGREPDLPSPLADLSLDPPPRETPWKLHREISLEIAK
jgi:hypothetical protein